jgi:hypothetical protein
LTWCVKPVELSLQIHIDQEAKIIEDETHLDILSSYIPTPDKFPERVVLGREVMEAVWADMERTELPSWITPTPRNWGTAERGKLSADQWCVICTIHLTITLIRLWGNETGQKKALLLNFMDLVSAITLANMCVMSPKHILAYDKLISHYVDGVKTLYPDEKIKPIHPGTLRPSPFTQRPIF